MKLKALLKTKGWSDEQIDKAFADPAVIAILDESLGTITSERDALKARDEEWNRKLTEEYNPAIAKAEKEAADARLRAVTFEEQVKIAKDYGYLAGDEAERRSAEAAERAKLAAGGQPGSYDPKRHPTFDDVAKFADAEGEAIAMASDLAQEYRYYTGKDLYEYETQMNGQTLRGMRAIRQEAKLARKPLDQFVAEKFDFRGARQRKTEEAQKAHDEQIRKEAIESTRREMAEKYGNPNMAQPIPSHAPFLLTKKADGKQPWEKTAQERKVARIQNAMQVQVASGQ
jgi:hypothetical protein